ncbi:outer membrane beta-barrel protein [candidate division KSB1 bacterium]|nr:outer membrane beta-barrel protein [candidate division KSB1 bacterium]
MSRLIIIFVVLMIIPAGIFGQEIEISKRTAEFYLNGGSTFPLKPTVFPDFYNPSLNVGIGFSYQINEQSSFLIEGGYHKFDLDENALVESSGGSAGDNVAGGDHSIFDLSVGLKSRFNSGSLRFAYYKFGLGFMNLRRDILEVISPDTSYFIADAAEVAVSLNLGAGLDYNLKNNIFIFGELQYSYAFTKDERTQYLPLKIGILYRKE